MPVDDLVFDVVIVGSGGGGLVAAIAARLRGLDPLVLEKRDVVGGSTAFSGGVMWIPNNPLMQLAGLDDSVEDAIRYVNALGATDARPIFDARRDAYVREAPRMLELLRQEGFRVGGTPYPDYHAQHMGARPRGRSIEALPFDKRQLGSLADAIRPRLVISRRLKIRTSEFGGMMLGLRTVKGFRTVARVAVRSAWAIVRRAQLSVGGEALVSRLLQIAVRHDVTVWRETPLVELWVEDGRVVGVVALRAGEHVRIRARAGVLLAGGGYAHNQDMRERYAREPSSTAWTLANPGETGDTLRAGIGAGAAVAMMDAVWSNMTSLMPGGEVGMHGPDRVLPHSIIVDGTGSRFVNESADHLAVADAVYERNKVASAIPSWLILDSQHRNRYPFLGAPPRVTPKAWVETGYMKRADTIAALAEACGLEPDTLGETVARFNGMAKAGRDLDFGRGEDVAARYYGDPRVKPNPTLGALDTPPFYAVALYPGDVGTSGGLLTNEHGQVLDELEKPIPGLYATGNNAAPLFGGKYPGAGGSIGPSMTFGYIAARHIADTVDAASSAAEGATVV
jgi:3-oxosteroid 1-dehydrogenase